MANNDLPTIIRELEQNIATSNHKTSKSLLSRAKINLLHQNALVPTAETPSDTVQAATQALELGALISIRLQDAEAFTRYFQQLQPFYEAPQSSASRKQNQRSKITGLYLLLLLSQGDYSGFHTQIETLEITQTQGDGGAFIEYPMRLEQWLMEGSYDRVWVETRSDRVPSEEFAVFSDILVGTIRSEVASCSEKAYSSIPVANAKNLLFLDSEGGVNSFSRERGWQAADGRVFFPVPDSTSNENDILETSGQVIENTLGYARELETIV